MVVEPAASVQAAAVRRCADTAQSAREPIASSRTLLGTRSGVKGPAAAVVVSGQWATRRARLVAVLPSGARLWVRLAWLAHLSGALLWLPQQRLRAGASASLLVEPVKQVQVLQGEWRLLLRVLRLQCRPWVRRRRRLRLRTARPHNCRQMRRQHLAQQISSLGVSLCTHRQKLSAHEACPALCICREPTRVHDMHSGLRQCKHRAKVLHCKLQAARRRARALRWHPISNQYRFQLSFYL